MICDKPCAVTTATAPARALLAAIDLYGRWRDDVSAVIERNRHAEKLAVQYLPDMID